MTEAVYRQMHRQFLAEAPAGSIIDSTRLSRAQTVDAVLALGAREATL